MFYFSWTSKNLAAVIGVPVDTLQRRINFWINKGIVAESSGAGSNDHLYTLVNDIADGGKTVANNEVLGADDDAETSVASVEDQLRKEMTVYEVLGNAFPYIRLKFQNQLVSRNEKIQY